tara:strand:+ start:538 stop:1716 length:1179 start_codon:yes stop_codon:yes gene_type:complete
MAIQDDVSNFFDRMLESGRQDAGRTDRAISVLPELDGRVRSSLEMYYQPEQYGSLEEAMRFDPSLVDRVMEAYDQQAGGLLDGGTYPDATMPDTSGAVPPPRPDMPTVPQPVYPTPQPVYPTNNPTIGLTDEELMQFEPVPYARANEIQTLVDQAAVMQGEPNRGGVSTAGLASEEMIDGFDDKERAAYARMIRDRVGASGAANMRPPGAEPRSALVNSQLQAVIDRERGANRGRVVDQATADDERRTLEFGALASTGAGNLVKGGIKGAQAVRQAGGLRNLLQTLRSRIGADDLQAARQATQGQYPIGVGTRFRSAPTQPRMMRDPVTGRMIPARQVGPQQLPYGPQPFQAVKTPAQLRTQATLDAARRAAGGYADGGRIRDNIMNTYGRM